MYLQNHPQQTPKLTQGVLKYHTFKLANEKVSHHISIYSCKYAC